jgi:hypothetical protein
MPEIDPCTLRAYKRILQRCWKKELSLKRGLSYGVLSGS